MMNRFRTEIFLFFNMGKLLNNLMFTLSYVGKIHACFCFFVFETSCATLH